MLNMPCGCVPGFFLCREAEKLWNDVIRKMRVYDDYIDEMNLYNKHLSEKIAIFDCSCPIEIE